MASQIVRPTGNITNEWEASSGGGYTVVNEEIEQPTAGDGNIRQADKNDDGLVDQYSMANPTNVSEITNITIWMYAYTQDKNKQPNVDIYDGVGFVGAQTCNWYIDYSWTSLSFSGLTWNATQGNALEIKFTANIGIEENDEHFLDTTYVVITYSPIPVVYEFPRIYQIDVSEVTNLFNDIDSNELIKQEIESKESIEQNIDSKEIITQDIDSREFIEIEINTEDSEL